MVVVVMLAAEDPAADGPLASTPRRSMDCADKANTATKKLVQARLPFKRLNPEPKEGRETKRTRTGPSAPPTLDSSALDRENEVDAPSLPLQSKPALVNGRGPLDCFMSRRKRPLVSSSFGVIDLTEDSNPTDAVKEQPSAPVKALCPVVGDAAQNAQHAEQAEEAETEMTPAVSQSSEENMETSEAELDLTLEGETEPEPQTPQQQEAEESQNESALSLSSTSSASAIESSPEPSKSTPATPASVPMSNTEQKKVKRRSLKSAQELDEKQRQREEKERQKQDARAAKEKKREEARRLKEEKEREKKEKKEKDEKERREKKERDDKEKAERQRAKEEQRKVKIEAKLEEKRKKEEEKRLKEEKERIKAEKAEITRFLQKPKTQLAPKTLASVCGKFAPFEIKEHMILAPLTRVHCEDAVLEELDRNLSEQDTSLKGLKDWIAHKPRKSGRTKSRHTDTMSDCLVVTDGPKSQDVPDCKRYGRMKLLQFHENYRPAYWGTWSKESTSISPRCPLRQDKELLDYEVDSDEEWEEEEPGESLSHSEGDDDDEGGEDDDDDDGFFVPHGYLSDGEGALEDEEGGDPEKQKVRQKLKAREWDELMSKRKLKVLEAVVIGCMWEGDKPSPQLLQPYAVCMLAPLHTEEPSTPEENASRQQRKEQLLTQLLPLLHGNVNSSKVIITEFQEFCRQQTPSPTGSPQNSDYIPPRIHVKRLIKENAVYEKRSTYRRCCWYVHAEVLARFGQESLSVPCKWTYLTSGAHTPRDEPTGQQLGSQSTSPGTPQSASTTPSNKRKSASNHSITKYMKKCADPEQTEAMETDGFQADTEEDDDDCIILSEQSGSSEQDGHTSTDAKNAELVDVDVGDAALPLPCPTPATA